MVVRTRSERVDHARRMVLEFLGSSVDLSLTEHVAEWNDEYGVDAGRYGTDAATVAQPVKVDNELYVRDYAKCILCYKCVEACGEDAQNTFAIDDRRPRLRRPGLDRVRRPAPRLGVRVLRQLHPRLPDRRADVPPRVRDARRRAPGTPERRR